MVKLTGFVLTKDGRAIGQALVKCGGQSVLTNFDGKFEFKGLKPGEYTLTVTIKGFKSREINVALKDEDRVETVYLDEGKGTSKIHGYVFDAETGKPLTSGVVVIALPFSNRYAQIERNGYYELNDLPSGSYEVIASPLNYISEKVKVELSEGDVKRVDFHCSRMVEEPPWG
ncbi:MAG: carboxypeptidase regulatory-like domain-containing protein [Candidatus Nezhaarchaeales archaeon]